MGLVTCNLVGESLQKWIRDASNREKELFADQLQDILELDSGEGLAKWIQKADDRQLKRLAESFNDILKFGAGEGLADWVENASEEDKDKLKKSLLDGLGLKLDFSEELKNISDSDLNSIAEKLRGRIRVYTTNPISGDGTKENPIDLKIAGGDNLLDIRQDGLNYSEEAPEDVSNLYVDASKGNDDNDGKRESPLRSINEALRRNKTRQAFTVHIHEDQTHEWRSSWGDWRNYNVAFFPYGEECDRLQKINPIGTAHWERSNEVPRPTIRFIADRLKETSNPDVKEARPTVMSNNSSTGEVVFFHAMILDFSYYHKPNEVVSDPQKGYFGQRDDGCDVSFCGCYLIPHKDSDYYLLQIDQAKSVLIDCSSVMYDNGGELYPGGVITLGSGAFLSISFRRAGLSGEDTVPDTLEEEGEQGLTFMRTMPTEDWGNRIEGIKTSGLAVNIRTTEDLGL